MISKLKKIIKNYTSLRQRNYIKGIVPHIKFRFMFNKRMICFDKYTYSVFSLKKKNVFNGYYDINPINNYRMLVHSCKNSSNTKSDSIELGYFNILDNKYYKITETKAWCWQQGSRLRWSKNKDQIIYNDCINQEYNCIFFDLNQKKIVKKLNFALYDITKDEKYGLSLNFSRLQRLRPGYGYDVLEDETLNENAPKNDGIFLVDISKNTCKLIISLHDLAKLNDKNNLYQHYINHISISPSGKKFIFFHLYAKEKGWSTQLISANIDGSGMVVLENEDLVSHYTWKSDNEVLITGLSKNNNFFYRIYETSGKYKKNIMNKKLNQDGHPSYISNDIFVTDTYPINDYQTVFIYNTVKKNGNDIMKLYADKRFVEECRCDLHPKIDIQDRLIFVDSTFQKGKRSVIMIRGVINEKKREETD